MRKKEKVNINEIMEQVDNVDIVDLVPRDRPGGNILLDVHNNNMIGTFNRDYETEIEVEDGDEARTKTLKGKVLASFQEDYHLVDHREMLATISDYFGEVVNGNYWMKDDCSRLYVYIYPEEMKQLIEHPETGEKDWIDFGIRFANSYDGSSALKLSTIAYRKVCENGMWAQTFKDRGYQRHTKNSSISEFRDSIESVLEAEHEDILMTYQESMTEKVPKVDVFLEEVWKNKHQALKEYIFRNVESREGVSKWEVYCKGTEALTHGFRTVHGQKKTAERYAEETLKNLHKDVNRILKVDLSEIDWEQDVDLMGDK